MSFLERFILKRGFRYGEKMRVLVFKDMMMQLQWLAVEGKNKIPTSAAWVNFKRAGVNDVKSETPFSSASILILK